MVVGTDVPHDTSAPMEVDPISEKGGKKGKDKHGKGEKGNKGHFSGPYKKKVREKVRRATQRTTCHVQRKEWQGKNDSESRKRQWYWHKELFLSDGDCASIAVIGHCNSWFAFAIAQ